jgi:uncharacterized protein YndB with AHSA1/START domain
MRNGATSGATVTELAAGRVAVALTRTLALDGRSCWEAITDRHELHAWFPCDVEVLGGTWSVGAELRFTFDEGTGVAPFDGRVLAIEVRRALAYTWGDESCASSSPRQAMQRR